MHIRLPLRPFRPRLWSTLLLVLVLIPTFFSLGQWQWGKAQMKLMLQQQYEAAQSAPPQPLAIAALHPPTAEENWQYRHVQLRGRFDAAHTILLDNQIYRGQVGYHVLAPFCPAVPARAMPRTAPLLPPATDPAAPCILVNRGWVSWGGNRARLPATPVPEGPLEIIGKTYWPATRFFALGAEESRIEWRRLWQHLDLPRYRKEAQISLSPLVLLLDAEDPSSEHVRDWPRPDDRITTHLGYAYQWYGFAIAAMSIWLWTAFQPHSTRKNSGFKSTDPHQQTQ